MIGLFVGGDGKTIIVVGLFVRGDELTIVIGLFVVSDGITSDWIVCGR